MNHYNNRLQSGPAEMDLHSQMPLIFTSIMSQDTDGASRAGEKKRKIISDSKTMMIDGTVCERCRKSKVKCDRRNPCGRCARLDVKCTPTPPSRRGRKQAKTMESCEGMVLDSIEKILKKEKKPNTVYNASKSKAGNNEDQKSYGIGIHFLIRTWIFNSFRRRSTFLLAKASKLACQYDISLDDIIGEIDGPMSTLPSLIFARSRDNLKIDDLIGRRLKLDDFDKSHLDIVKEFTGAGKSLTEGGDGLPCYIFGRQSNKGYMRYFFTADFEKDFKTDEEEPDFCKREPCWRPIFNNRLCHDKIMKSIAGAYKETMKVNTPSTPKVLSIQAAMRSGDVVDVQVAISVCVNSTTQSSLLFAMKRVKPKRKKRRKKTGPDTTSISTDSRAEFPFVPVPELSPSRELSPSIPVSSQFETEKSDSPVFFFP